jgi:hypothetical protein
MILPEGLNHSPLAAVSGNKEGRNKPALQGENNLGPTPVGMWKLGPPVMHNFHMKDGTWEHRIGMSLTAAGKTNTHGRKNLVVHEAHGTETNGCVGLSKKGMETMVAAYNSGMQYIYATPNAHEFGYQVAKQEGPHGTPNYHNGKAGDVAARKSHPSQTANNAPSLFSPFQ